MSNAEENTELSRCGSLTDNLEHTNAKLVLNTLPEIITSCYCERVFQFQYTALSI